jgi:hypothetical protein
VGMEIGGADEEDDVGLVGDNSMGFEDGMLVGCCVGMVEGIAGARGEVEGWSEGGFPLGLFTKGREFLGGDVDRGAGCTCGCLEGD